LFQVPLITMKSFPLIKPVSIFACFSIHEIRKMLFV
jgi:hypothetical protein